MSIFNRSSPARLAVHGATDTGKLRRHNEDAWGCDARLGVAVVADGMGGLSRGEVASRALVDTALETMRKGGDALTALRAANTRIYEMAAPGGGPMGATAVMLNLEGRDVRISWVGDSRAYLMRKGEFRLLTRDHSFVQELIDAGAITPEEAVTHPNRNVVTRAVGVNEAADLRIEQITLALEPGDRIVLCTDGLHGYLGDAAIEQTLRQALPCEEVAAALVRRTLKETQAGDNVTVVCVCVED